MHRNVAPFLGILVTSAMATACQEADGASPAETGGEAVDLDEEFAAQGGKAVSFEDVSFEDVNRSLGSSGIKKQICEALKGPGGAAVGFRAL